MRQLIKIVLIAVGLLAVLVVGGYFLLVSSFQPSPVSSYGTTEEAFAEMGYTTMLPTWLPEDCALDSIAVWDGLGVSYRGEGKIAFSFSAKKTDATVPDLTDSDKDYELVEDLVSGAIEWHPGLETHRAYWHQNGILYEIDASYGFPLEDLRSVIEGVK
jgi:hypothetical protein